MLSPKNRQARRGLITDRSRPRERVTRNDRLYAGLHDHTPGSQLNRVWPQITSRSKSMVMGRCSSPLCQEVALKAGWLKRQRTIMRNWQLRWFVLRSDGLYFYKDQEETKPQGCILLQGSQVSELSANQNDSGRHLFEMVPGGRGEKDRSGLSESLLLMANSQSDMEEWVKAIRRAIWAPLGGGIFGQHLEDTVKCESGWVSGAAPLAPLAPLVPLVPLLVQQCVRFIGQHGLREEGLFRMPGQTNHVRELRDAFDCGDKPIFDSTTDVHTVASLLKLYLRELPEPVVPFRKYPDFLVTAQLLAKDQDEGIQELTRLVKTLPQVNFNLLRYICRFLDEVQSHASQNKMNVQNLATVFGPNILRAKLEDPQTMMEGSSQVQQLMTVLISEHSRLYPEKTVTSPDRAPSVQRGRVEWFSQEDMLSSTALQRPPPCKEPNAPSQEPLLTLPSSALASPETGSVPQGSTEGDSWGKKDGEGGGMTERPSEGKSQRKLLCGTDVTPSKPIKSLSSWRSSIKGGSGVLRGKIGGSAVDVSTLPGGNWLRSGLSSIRNHRRTASTGERLKESLDPKETFKDLLPGSYAESCLSLNYPSHSQKSLLKDSSLQIDSSCSSVSPPPSVRNTTNSNRLSVYDNVTVTTGSLSLPGGSPSPWTSCEISLAELTASEHDTVTTGFGSGQAHAGSSVLGDSSSALDLCVSSVSCSEGEAGDDIMGQRSGGNKNLFTLVTELKEELKRQRSRYEAHVSKMEELCSSLRLQSVNLEEDLDQEKKRSRMLEIRLGNSERARQDAETRNVLLQKEMEEFFATLGDLTTGTHSA